MFDRIISFLRDIPGAERSLRFDAGDDARVAAAALLIHVMDADGVRRQEERARLRRALTEAYQVSGAALDALFAAAEQADQEAIDLYAFTSVLKRHLDAPARLAFIGLLWDVVYADGERHELEDNTVWRIAELIGVDAPSRVAERQRARARTPGTPRETGSDD